jgi:hypothetical protein
MSLQPTSGSIFNLNGEVIEQNPNEETFYFIDFSKLQNVNDLVKILASLGFGISNKNPYYNEIKQFLDHDRPVKMK